MSPKSKSKSKSKPKPTPLEFTAAPFVFEPSVFDGESKRNSSLSTRASSRVPSRASSPYPRPGSPYARTGSPYQQDSSPYTMSPTLSEYAEEQTLTGDGYARDPMEHYSHHLANVIFVPQEATDEDVKNEGDFPDGGLRAWLVVLGGVCVTFSTFGFVNTWGIFQAYYETHILEGTSPSAISWIGSIQYSLVFLPGLITGRLFDLGHFHLPHIIASIFLVVGTLLSAECRVFWQFLLCQGVIIGLASGFLFGPTIAVVSHWFRARRGLAFGILASGASIGGTVLPIAVKKLIPIIGFRWAMRVIAMIMFVMLTIATLTLRRRLSPKKVSGGLLNLKAFLHVPYTLYVLASVVSFLGLYTVLTYLEVYGVSIGFSDEFAFYLISITNAASLIGRVGAGFSTDRLGPINTLIPSTFVAGICTFIWPFARTKGTLIAVAIVDGIACGVFVGMLPAPVAKMGSMDDIGRRTGMLMTVVAIGAVAGPPISGAIRDNTGSFVPVGYYAGSMIVLCVMILVSVKYATLGKLSGKL